MIEMQSMKSATISMRSDDGCESRGQRPQSDQSQIRLTTTIISLSRSVVYRLQALAKPAFLSTCS